jgi:uncharacterized cupin superfamily protein
MVVATHWHDSEDEFVVILTGEAVLVDEAGETTLRAGDCAAFPKNVPNGHHFQNRTAADCVFIAVSAGSRGGGDYPDIDMRFTREGYFRKDGTRYDTERLR